MSNKFVLISGPCSLENETNAMTVAEGIINVVSKYPNIDYIFKSSWTKANRTRGDTFTGLSFDESMRIFTKVKQTFGVRILTDVHETIEVKELEPYVDVLQIPAYLSRQTNLILEAAKSKPINIKKGQFMSPNDMRFALDKAKSVGQKEIYACERGSSFGYDTLVVDFTAIPIMKSYNVPVILDATHCVQRKLQEGISGGLRQYVPHMCKAGIAVGADGLFLEVHPNPEIALSDAGTQWRLSEFENLLKQCMELYNLISSQA